jgi:hypothetical protein
VNTAARLEQAAAPGTVLIGEVTHHLVRDAVEADGPRALTLKGKRHEVMAWAMLGHPRSRRVEAPPERHAGDRQDQLRRLLAFLYAFMNLARTGAPRLHPGAASAADKAAEAARLKGSVAAERRVSAYAFTCRLAYGLTCRSAEVSTPVRLS